MRGLSGSANSFLLALLSLLMAPVPAIAQIVQRSAGTAWPDGGVRETLESIVISPKPGAPFTMSLQTEWVKTLSDGSTITLVNERRIARDSKGRFYQERMSLVPKNGNQQSTMTAIQIADPVKHVLYTCMMDGRHLCGVEQYSEVFDAAHARNELRGTRTLTLPENQGFVNHEDLGNSSTEGVETRGTRITTIYDPGIFGNDNRLTVEREFWYSPHLAINLISRISDARFGTQSFTATDLNLSEPDPRLFSMPDRFRVAINEHVPSGLAH